MSGGEEPQQLRGRLSKFLHPPGPDGFGIAVVDDDLSERPWVIRGPLWGLHEQETVRVWGRAEEDPKWGRRFRVEAVQPALPAGAEALLRWLKSGRVPGIGATVAERIVTELGPDALEQVRHDPETLSNIKGLTAGKRKALHAAIAEIDAAEEGALFLFGLGLGPGLVQKIVRRHGLDAARAARDRPYALAIEIAGIGFRTADRIAKSVGIAHLQVERLRAALTHVMAELAGQGHTAPPRELVLRRAAELAEVDFAAMGPALQGALDHAEVLEVRAAASAGAPERICTPALYEAECRLGEWIGERSRRTGGPAQGTRTAIEAADEALGFALEGRQREAVAQGLTAPLLIITGGPGTGKTTILKGLLAALRSLHGEAVAESLALAAPTGRAARRMTEATGQQAKTLHRLLEYEPRQQRFLRDRQRPLDAELVVVDEASMIDVPLAAALVGALRDSARLILVGDADQLPSVGPGAFLTDILNAPSVLRVRLSQVYRQGTQSRIALAAHGILKGEVPASAARGDGGDFFMITRTSAESIADTVLEVVRDRLPRYGFDPITDVQVLAPVHRGQLGTEALNERLRSVLNPSGKPTLKGLRVGDKLIQTRNDYELDIFNGDIGTVIGLTASQRPAEASAQGHQSLPMATEPCVVVRFGDREVSMRLSQLEWLELAYAVTVHKAQGSEYPAVVMPVHLGQHMMLQRNLLYTALTRARRFAVLVGQPEALARAVHNAAPLQRFTQLGGLLHWESL